MYCWDFYEPTEYGVVQTTTLKFFQINALVI